MLNGALHPAFYLAIPPAFFSAIIKDLGSSGLAENARVIVEKPLGVIWPRHASSTALHIWFFQKLRSFALTTSLVKKRLKTSLFPIRKFVLGADLESQLRGECSDHAFGRFWEMEGRGSFYDGVGCLRDVIQNHLFQIVALLAMEPPAGRDFEAQRSEKAKVFQAMHALKPEDLVRGQFEGYLQEFGVAKDSDTETYCALRLFIDSWRWAGVPWYLRSGKCLAETAAEILVQLKAPPQKLFEDTGPEACRANYLRFQLSPHPAIALAARVKRAGEEYVGDQKELYLLNAQPDEQAPYERQVLN